ncbi:hypothetical protein LINPERHAP2_LOCUS401 [Linum perenne]
MRQSLELLVTRSVLQFVLITRL